MKLRLDEFDKIIFDMDGVITSEQAYWYSAALTAYELLVSHEFYGVCGIDEIWLRKNYVDVYNTVMCGGRTVKAVKRLGVNTNLDLAFMVFCVSKYIDPYLERLDSSHFQSVCMFIENIDIKVPELYEPIALLAEQSRDVYKNGMFARNGSFFRNDIAETFDKWYIGGDGFSGFCDDETLLFPTEEIEALLKKLNDRGIRLGMGTGRPTDEIEKPLKNCGVYDYFDKELFCTYDEVCKAEKELKPENPLAKPEPFVFLKAAIGSKYSDAELASGSYDKKELERTLIVGDAPSDLYSAKSGGFKFAGVLTGAEGESIKEWFEVNKADYILKDIFDLCD